MKSLKESLLQFKESQATTESLFDNDLIQKSLPTFGDRYKLTDIDVLWGRYYNNFNSYEEDKELVDKIFKSNKLKNIKPVNTEGVEFRWYKSKQDFYDPFLRLLSIINGFYLTESEQSRFDTQHRYGIDLCKDEWSKLDPYINKGKTEVRLWKSSISKNVCFTIMKNFGSAEKYIQLKAYFKEKYS